LLCFNDKYVSKIYLKILFLLFSQNLKYRWKYFLLFLDLTDDFFMIILKEFWLVSNIGKFVSKVKVSM
jgi:hypothetical protein